jgi:hypothetical protein
MLAPPHSPTGLLFVPPLLPPSSLSSLAACIPRPPAPPPSPPRQPSFLKDYGRIAVRKLLFFHGKNGCVRIRDLVNSIVLQVGGRRCRWGRGREGQKGGRKVKGP